MLFRRAALGLALAASLPCIAMAQSDDLPKPGLSVELNTLQDEGTSCRLTFVVKNQTEQDIDKAVFETVIFDATGGVAKLSLFDFRDLPIDRPRVRQFDLPGMSCESIGQALINGTNSCVVGGAESDLCQKALTLGSRTKVELLG